MQERRLDMVDKMFKSRVDDIKISSWVEEVVQSMQNIYLEKLDDPQFLDRLPYGIPNHPGTVIHIRGMVQDMLRPEFFPIHYTLNHTSKPGNTLSQCALYLDDISCPPDFELMPEIDHTNALSERHVLSLVPIPGESDWAKVKDSRMIVSENGDANKLNLDKLKDCLPLPDSGDSSVYNMKVYGPIGEKLRLNDVVEIIGIVGPQMDSINTAHVLALRVLNYSSPLANTVLENKETIDIAQCRQQILSIFESLLGGDALVAEYLLCHVISSIYSRQDGRPVGSFPLNITNISESVSKVFVNNIRNCFTSLLPKVAYLPLSIDYLNSGRIVPCKDYTNDKLISGHLQLADGTQMVIDETVMNTGILVDKGVRNVEAIRQVVQQQQLTYNFQFGGCQVNTDIKSLIISTAPSLLKAEYTVSLLSTPPQTFVDPSAECLSILRSYLARVSNAQYMLTDDMQKYVQEQFVHMRKDDPKTDAETLHQILTTARLLSLSQAIPTLNESIWNKAKAMYMDRKARMKK